jgi:hypothetical protein
VKHKKPVLVTVPNVPILAAGIEYKLSTGPRTFTPDDLRDIVAAANEDMSIPAPRLKIGHIDPRYNGTNPWDGTPAFGKATNLSLGENDMEIFADYVGVPKWLADIMPTAYPSRSVEILWDVESQTGRRYRAVCAAVAILGVVWPGITVLEDLPHYYGEEMPSDVEVVADAASIGEEGEVELKDLFKGRSAAAADLDDVRRAFYDDFATGDRMSWWIRQFVTDPNELVVEDDASGQLYLVGFKSNAKGVIKFADPDPVRIAYIPDERKQAAAASLADALTAGREVQVSYASRADSRPANNTQGGVMDREVLIQRLGLPVDATDEQIKAGLDEMNAASAAAGITQASGETTEEETPEEETPEEETAEEETPEDETPDTASAEVVTIDKGTLASLQAGAKKGEEAFKRQQDAEKKLFFDGAIASGKIPPARRQHWETLYDKDPVGTRAAVGSIDDGLVPVSELGHTGGGAEGETETVGYPEHLLPEVQRRKAHGAAIASGGLSRSRVQREEGFR